MVGGFLVNIPGGKEKARHIFINAAGGCEVVPRYAVVGAAGWQSEVREGRGAWSVRRRGCAFFSCQHFNGFGKALAEKLHDKINGAAALALAVAIPFVAPDGQAVVPFPSVFLSGAFQRFSLRLQERNKVGLVGAVYLFLGVIHKISTPFSGLYRAAWCGSASAPAGRRGVQYPRTCGFFEARQPRRVSLSACHIPLPAVI